MRSKRKTLVLTLSATFILMALLVVFISRVIFRTVFSSVDELGKDKALAISADLENYLDTAKSVLWLAADTVDHMVQKGATDEEIVEYITRESSRTEQQFDESYTGIYGVIRGNYVDGVGWVPPDDYDPTERDWYKITVAEKGDAVIVPPYVDAQTGNVIISVGRALTDNNDALALDLTLKGVQDIVESIQINGQGYGFIINNDGMVIAHADKNQIGLYYNEIADKKELFDQINEISTGSFVTELDGETCTFFVNDVLEQWHLVLVIKNKDLYKAPMSLLFVSILIIFTVYVIISVFYIMGYRYERRINTKMEEMKEIEQKKDFEAKILKLEKSAADTANKAKSNFLADMSHEIRTPINTILGMNEMILHESGEEGTIEYATNIKNAGNTLLSIINTILDFSKIEDGRMHLVPVTFETKDMISGLYNSICERAKDKNLDLIFDVDETIPSRLEGDDVRISQVVMNLLTNAVKYTEKGSITFKMQNLGKKNGIIKLLFSVKDTGIGIRKEDIDKLAISFERVDEKRNRNIEGTGLGISIVTKLLIMMNSELKIKSEYGVGSEFYFELPIKAVEAEPIGKYDVTKTVYHKSDITEITTSMPDARIILTDDNEMNRKVASNLMKLFRIEPTICSSGKETIEMMKKNRYDILFLDHMMPHMDGIETLGLLKANSLLGECKVIALTANAVVGAREQYIQDGFDDYLSKPISITKFEKILRKYLPEDIIEKPSDAVSGEEAESQHEEYDNDRLNKLVSLGINVKEGLVYCGGEEEFYLEVVGDYSAAVEDNIKNLSTYLQEGNMKDYKILVHSVKSSSKTIGAMDLFEKARALEMAAGEENVDYINDNHSKVMEEYRQLAEELKKQ